MDKPLTDYPLQDLTQKIIGSAIEVHRVLGPGLLESAYEHCLVYELQQLRLSVEQQKPLPLVYKAITIEQGYRIDIFVEGKVIVELKTVDQLTDVHVAQILTYMKLSNCQVGLLINFNVKMLKSGIRRFVL